MFAFFELVDFKPKLHPTLKKLTHNEKSNLNKVMSRLLGKSIEATGVTKGIWFVKTKDLPPYCLGIRIYRLRKANSILQIEFEIDSISLDLANNFRKLKSPQIKKIADHLGLSICLDYSVDAVVGSASSTGLGFDSNILDGWIHIESRGDDIGFVAGMARELAARVAIEKSTLNWATSDPKNFIEYVFKPATASSIVRKWPVQLLIDRQDMLQKFVGLRESLNLSAVRTEVLEQGRHWWTVAAYWLAALVGILTIVQTVFAVLAFYCKG